MRRQKQQKKRLGNILSNLYYATPETLPSDQEIAQNNKALESEIETLLSIKKELSHRIASDIEKLTGKQSEEIASKIEILTEKLSNPKSDYMPKNQDLEQLLEEEFYRIQEIQDFYIILKAANDIANLIGFSQDKAYLVNGTQVTREIFSAIQTTLDYQKRKALRQKIAADWLTKNGLEVPPQEDEA